MRAAFNPSNTQKEVKYRTNVYIGIDIGKKRCDTCILDDKGDVLERDVYRNTAKYALEYAKKIAAKYGAERCQAACETTGSMWIGTIEAFDAEGIHIKLANTYHMAIIAKTGAKTDKIDAKKIAEILRAGMIPECYVPDRLTRATRRVIRERIKIVQSRARVVNRLHTLLDMYDVVIDATDMYSPKALAQLDATRISPENMQMILENNIRQIRYFGDEIAALDRHLEQEAAQNKYARLLVSMPGVGIHTAQLLAVEIADVSRFRSPKAMVSWAGLCPTVHQSGDKSYTGRMKKTGRNTLVNWTMCEAANVAARHDPRMKVAYLNARRRHADKHALGVVVVANKMITIMWHT